jgi:hypothetical protein
MSGYEYEEADVAGADDAALKLTENGAYVGTFTSAVEVISDAKGSVGLELEFETRAGDKARFSLWTRKEDGTKLFGNSMLMAILKLTGVKRLDPVSAVVKRFGEEETLNTYPALCGKLIGVVLQKELYTKGDGTDGSRMNLFGTFHPETKMTSTEIIEHASKPERFEKMLKGLKTKDTRKQQRAQTATPPIAGSGDF